MKRSKRMIALVVVLGVVCIATFGVTKYEKKQEEIKNSDEVILEIDPDSVESISWNYAGEGLEFHKGDTGWLYDGDEAFPVDEEKITDILTHFESFGVSFVIENVENYGQYGLDDPEGMIHLTTSDQTYEVKLGDYSKMDEQRYVDIGDGNVYLVSDDPMLYLETELSGVILNDETPYFETVSDITFEGEETCTAVYTEESADSYSEEDVYFTDRNGRNVPLDTDKVTNYLDTITALSLSNYVTYNATEEEVANCGLDDSEWSVTVNYTYTDEDENECEDTFVLHIGSNPKELEEAQKAEEDGEEEIPAVTRYARVGDSQIIYEIDEDSYEVLAAASYDALRHREVIWADSDMITGIDVTLEGETHVLTSKTDKDDMRIWYYEEEEVEIGDLNTALKSLEADQFTEEAADQKEEISLTVYLDNENFPQIEIQLYRYDGSLCLAVIDNESVSLVDRSDVMELVEAVQAIVLN